MVNQDLATACLQWPLLKQCKLQLLEQIRAFAVIGELGQDLLLIDQDGKVFGFGRNRFGILGLGHKEEIRDEPQLLPELPDGKEIVDIQHGMCHCLVLTKDGTVWCFGNNEFGQCAQKPAKMDGYFVRPSKLELSGSSEEKFVSIRSRQWHSMALTKTGAIYAWGDNDYGQIGVGHKTSQWTPVKVEGFGEPGGLVAISIECGGGFSLALTDKGEVYGWGWNQFGQLGLTSNCPTTPVKIEVVANVSPMSIKAIAVGYLHSMFLTNDGQLYVCGDNQLGQLGLESGNMDRMVLIQKLTIAGLNGQIGSISAICNLSVALSETGAQCFVWGEINQTGTNKQTIQQEPLLVSCQSIDQAIGQYLHERFTLGLVKLVDQRDCKSNDDKNSATVATITNNNPLLERISAQFNQPDGSDVQFLVEGKTIHANLGFLQLVCPGFVKSLASVTSPITIEQSYPVFYTFIRYLYTGQLDAAVSWDQLLTLLQLSVTYQDQSLTERCTRQLSQSMTIANCCQLYQISIKYQLKSFEQSIVEFIQQNIGPVLSSDAYRELDGDLCKSLVISLIPVLAQHVSQPPPTPPK